MIKTIARNKVHIVWVVVFILCLLALSRASMNLKKTKNSFRDEMAQRFDLEEKLTNLEKRRDVLNEEQENLKEQLKKSQDEILQLKDALTASDNEKATLKGELEKATTALAATGSAQK
jgi:chromosome segregation ATPase